MTDTETKPFGGYGFAIRTFWIKASDLVVSRRWERESHAEPDAGGRFLTSITGKAVSEKDSVCVIGKDQEIKEFTLNLKSDECVKQEWEEIRRLEKLVQGVAYNTPEMRVKRYICEELDKCPPTAALFVTEDNWEIGSKGGWSIACAVPPSVLAQLEAELLAQRAHELHIGIEWEGGLVRDEHAPPSVPTSWGLFTINEEQGPETLHGHVKLIEWHASDASVTFNEVIP